MADTDKAAKIPPQNLEAEKSLLGSVLIDQDALIQVADQISADDFYDPSHEAIYAAMVKLYEKRRPVDILTLSNQLKEESNLEKVGGASYLTELTNYVPTATNVEHYASIVKEKSTRRKLLKASEEIGRDSFNEKIPVSDLLETAEKNLF